MYRAKVIKLIVKCILRFAIQYRNSYLIYLSITLGWQKITRGKCIIVYTTYTTVR